MKALCERDRHGEQTEQLLGKVIEFRTKPTKCGSRSKTAVETTTYHKFRSQPVKPDGNVITHVDSVALGLPPSSDDAKSPSAKIQAKYVRPHFAKSQSVIPSSQSVIPSAQSVTHSKRVSFDEYVETHGIQVDEFIEQVQTHAGLNLLTEMRRSPISVVSAPEWYEIEITVDSGACDTVMPTKLGTHISMIDTAKSKSGFEFEVANGEGLLNMGERRCFMMTENSDTMKRIAFQCADVHKPLLSVSRLADQGYECTLGKLGGVLRDVDTGDMIPLHRRDNLYVMRAWIKQDDSGFTRPEYRVNRVP